MCCVPTLLATIDTDLPSLRFLLLSGEACPRDLVARWYRPGRTILNAYGPTEATVTATLTELRPEKRVTIGAPLPTYSIVILDESENKTAPEGALGEIGIAGIGLRLRQSRRSDRPGLYPRFPRHRQQPLEAKSTGRAISAALSSWGKSNTTVVSTPRSRSGAIASN